MEDLLVLGGSARILARFSFRFAFFLSIDASDLEGFLKFRVEIYYLEDIERTGDEFLQGFPFVLPSSFPSMPLIWKESDDWKDS